MHLRIIILRTDQMGLDLFYFSNDVCAESLDRYPSFKHSVQIGNEGKLLFMYMFIYCKMIPFCANNMVSYMSVITPHALNLKKVGH